VEDYEGLGKRFPLLFIVFALASLALIGIPPLGGFTSKWAIATAAAGVGGFWAGLGVAALCVSAFLTGLYLLDVLILACWPLEGAESPVHAEKNGWQINLSLVLLSVLLVLISVGVNEIYAVICGIAGYM